MGPIDFNRINSKIDQMGFDSWKVMKSSTTNTGTETTAAKTDTTQVSDRDKKINSQIASLQTDVGINSTGSGAMGSIEENLTKIKAALEREKTGKVDNALNPENVAKSALDAINTTAANTAYKGNKVAEKFTTDQLGLSNFDVNSKDALAQVNAALEKVKAQKSEYNTNLNNAGDKLDVANTRKMQYEQADQLMSNTASSIKQTPAQALLAQAGLKAESIYSLLNTM